MNWFASECPDCELNDYGVSRLQVEGSREYELTMYDAFHTTTEAGAYIRLDRPDYWDLVIHFCRAEQFQSILREGRIVASQTGSFKMPAVCLTDAPFTVAKHFKRRYGPYGFVFSKHVLLQYGGGPAVYLNDAVLSAQIELGVADALRPFINVYRIPSTAPAGRGARYVDFLHDREWRVPHDILLSDVQPMAYFLPETVNPTLYPSDYSEKCLRFLWTIKEMKG